MEHGRKWSNDEATITRRGDEGGMGEGWEERGLGCPMPAGAVGNSGWSTTVLSESFISGPVVLKPEGRMMLRCTSRLLRPQVQKQVKILPSHV